MRDSRLLTAALLVAFLLLGVGGERAAAQEWKQFRVARQASGFDSVSVVLIYGAGRLAVAPADSGWLYDVEVRYDASRFTPARRWSASDGEGRLRFHLSSADSEGARGRIRVEEMDLDVEIDDLKRLGDAGGRAELALSRTVPTSLELVVGAAESALELGGIPLTGVDVSTGASDTRLTFDRPNPVPMGRMALRTGAASFRAQGLGNAGFERFEFKGGVGDVTLDFSGEWRRDATASISMGVGALRVRIPSDLGVRIRKKSFLTSFDPSGLQQVGDVWQTANWDSAEVKLVLEVDAAFGSIDVDRVP